MLYNLEEMIDTHDGREHISVPFSNEEIDNVVRQMPIDKALGPDGFNGLFLRNVGT
jgi:hypothetical protein